MKYLKKTNVRKHTRSCKGKNCEVREHARNVKGKQVLGTIKLNNLNYKQSKRLFPGLEPYGDIDGDGVVNSKDCHPFDTTRQHDSKKYPFFDEEAAESDERYFRNQDIRDFDEEKMLEKRRNIW
jgi:hypothetical protein